MRPPPLLLRAMIPLGNRASNGLPERHRSDGRREYHQVFTLPALTSSARLARRSHCARAARMIAWSSLASPSGSRTNLDVNLGSSPRLSTCCAVSAGVLEQVRSQWLADLDVRESLDRRKRTGLESKVELGGDDVKVLKPDTPRGLAIDRDPRRGA